MAFLDWCKLFYDKRGEHYWRKVLPAMETAFMAGLLTELSITEAQFGDFAKSVAHYRDKVIAHADVFSAMEIPALDIVINSTIYFYKQLRAEWGLEPCPVAPDDLHATFQKVVDDGCSMFEVLLAI